ncbi:MAG: GHMP kinase [Flavobacteriaceae bacterium]|nr:GHMP kinase [Flavobacteriaceae bacterium]
MTDSNYYSHGKLLITGEYLVLDGAKSLALPTKKGQSLTIQNTHNSQLNWESFDENGNRWLSIDFDLPKLRIISETFDSAIEDGSDSLAMKLQEILLESRRMNPEFLTSETGLAIKSELDFPRNWGLGSSSTLINNIASWAKIDAFELQFKTFGGSAYDIACAQSNTPILYQLVNKNPIIRSVSFDPIFKEQLFFVYLNKKQNSREGITEYTKFKGEKDVIIKEISELTNEMLTSNSIEDFERILIEHENLISSIIQQDPIQKRLFSDYFGRTKSLGAWGGDFILATGNENSKSYFISKGYHTVISYQEMVL